MKERRAGHRVGTEGIRLATVSGRTSGRFADRGRHIGHIVFFTRHTSKARTNRIRLAAITTKTDDEPTLDLGGGGFGVVVGGAVMSRRAKGVGRTAIILRASVARASDILQFFLAMPEILTAKRERALRIRVAAIVRRARRRLTENGFKIRLVMQYLGRANKALTHGINGATFGRCTERGRTNRSGKIVILMVMFRAFIGFARSQCFRTAIIIFATLFSNTGLRLADNGFRCGGFKLLFGRAR